LIRSDLPARNIVASDFAMLNERLAAHYGLPSVRGVARRRTRLPEDSVRGGFLTQAAVLKVTANGTTTSPVLRVPGSWSASWVCRHRHPRPACPPWNRYPGRDHDPSTTRPASNPGICSACHAKIDPAGFALENFDVMGGWRDRYRSEAGGEPAQGIAKSGQKFAFHHALPVDASGELPMAGGSMTSGIRACCSKTIVTPGTW
jgi:hypothetical protein